MLHHSDLLQLLKMDVVPALGCTEPVCVAFCCANASSILEDTVVSVEVEVNNGIYKNGMSAGIPNCKHVGLHYAAALGSFLKNPDKQLQLLNDITSQTLQQASTLINNKNVHIHLNPKHTSLYVKATLYGKHNKAICIIEDAHTQVTLLQKNNEILDTKSSHNNTSENTIIEELKNMNIADFISFVDQCNYDDLSFMMEGVEMNEALADYSKNTPIGVGIGDSLRIAQTNMLLSNSILGNIITKVASATESRLDGCPYPTMSSAGAGTKGLVVILPVNELANALQVPPLKKVRALAFAHILNRYINAHIGKLSPMCSCVMASSTAACAAMTYLMDGNISQIHYAIRNMCGSITGMICDGGKVGCALKVATGSSAALISAISAIHNAPIRESDGIVSDTAEECIKNVAYLTSKGMHNLDSFILDIMKQK